MGFLDYWLKPGKSVDHDINVTKIKENIVEMGEMAAGNQVAAHETIARMIEQRDTTAKILIVQDGEYLPHVTDYALKMAQRLGSEIIALDVTDAPLQFSSGDRQDYEIDRFSLKAHENAANFAIQAKARGVNMKHVIEIGDPEELIARLIVKDASIRHVLTKPDKSNLSANQESIPISILDVNCAPSVC